MTRIQLVIALIAGLVIALPVQADEIEPEPYVEKQAAPVPVAPAAPAATKPAATEPAPVLDYALIFELAGQWTWTNPNRDAEGELDDDDYGSLEGSARGSIPLSDILPITPFFLTHTDPDSAESIYFFSSLTIVPDSGIPQAPEPAAGAIFGLGLLTLGWMRRRRTVRAAA